MSIPDRLFRLARGYWSEAVDRIEGAESEAAAYQELADALRKPEPAAPALEASSGTAAPGAAPRRPQGTHDPLEASYHLLQLRADGDLDALEEAYEARMEELRPEQFPAGSAERGLIEAKRQAVEAAYEKLRDALNPTETRFEHLEL